MRPSRRPTHLLVGAHPAVQQPLHRALRCRRRYRLLAAPRCRVINDQLRLSGYIRLEASQHGGHLARRRGLWRRCRRRSFEDHQRFANKIESPSHLTMPETPMDVLDGIGKASTFLTLGRRVRRPALGGLSDVLDAHREVEPVQDVLGRANAGGLSQVARSAGAVAEDGDRRRRRPKVVQHVAQLLHLPIGLGRHAAEHNLRAGVVADLRNEDLEGPHLVAA